MNIKRVSLSDAPKGLNINDKAFWVIGWNEAIAAMEAEPEAPAVPCFPTMLRKMWSGREVQDWLDKHWGK